MAPRHGDVGLDGILVVNKPAGPTSHDVVALVRRLSGTRRVGHGGTLDPFAAGVLPIFLGKATRLVEYHQADRKAYRATICFGASSTTDDLEGELTPAGGPPIARDAVERGLAAMEGVTEQRPPAYSAIKIGGRRAYAMARAGESPVMALRTVTLHRLTLTSWDDSDPARPIAMVDVECSPGTYVRAVARDLGSSLGSGAYLGGLIRTASGSFRLEDSLPLDELRAAAATDRAALERYLRPIDDGLDLLPEVPLTRDEVSDVLLGRFVRPAAGLPGGDPDRPMRLVDPEGRLVAIGLRNAGRIVPTKVLVDLASREIGQDRAGREPNAASPPETAVESPA